MFYTIAGILGVLWLLGMVTGYTAGYFIHILLVIAVVMVLLNLYSREEISIVQWSEKRSSVRQPMG